MGKNKESKLSRKLQITVSDENTFEQFFSFSLSPKNLFILVGSIIIILVVGTMALIAGTSLKEFIPGYPTGQERLEIIENYHRTNQLVAEIERRDVMLQNLRAVLSGKLPAQALDPDSLAPRATHPTQVHFKKSDADSIFRAEVEAEAKFNISEASTTGVVVSRDTKLEMMFFFPPLKGVVTDKFNEVERHFGTDIVAVEGAAVKSCLDGTVIFAEWTLETGYVIEIQHENQIISVYKHNSKLLKGVGDRVRAGDAIAFVGNMGELTTGPHLHFELWHAGTAINPEYYMSFE